MLSQAMIIAIRMQLWGKLIFADDANYDPQNIFHINQNIEFTS